MYVRNRIGRRLSIGLVSLILVGASSACGSSSDDKAASSDGLTTVKVGNLVFVGTAPMQLGIKKGFFKDEGLSLDLTEADNPAAIAGQLTSGQADIGFTTTAFLATADSQGAGLQAVAPVDGLIDTKAPASGVVVKGDSPIKTLADLEGKKVGVVALGSELHVLTLADMDAKGGDSSKMQAVQLPFPQMEQGVASGNVDAAVMTEPFLSAALAKGDRMIAAPEIDLVPNGTVTAWAASTKYISQHADVVKKFLAATQKTLDYAQAHPDEVEALIPTYTGLDPKVLEKMNLGTVYDPAMDLASIQKMGELLKQYGFIDTVPSLEDMVSDDVRNQ